MTEPLPIDGCRLPIAAGADPVSRAPGVARGGFSMVELLVAMTLLTLIVLALMAVFTSTQRAFRASVTQTDILEGSRAAMELIVRDLNTMVPSDCGSNYYYGAASAIYPGAANFFVTNYSDLANPYKPLIQPLPGSSLNRTNVVNCFFILGRENTRWVASGYIVNASSSSPLYPLYRFSAETNINFNPISLFWNFQNTIYNAQYYNQWTNLSHVIDGVVQLRLRAYDPKGYQLTNTYQTWNGLWTTNANIVFTPGTPGGDVGMKFCSNAVPAAVELELGVLEDHALQRAESLGIAGSEPWAVSAQWKYLQNQSGHVYVFRQRVTVPNVDPSAYQ
jgi:hypothetical protein